MSYTGMMGISYTVCVGGGSYIIHWGRGVKAISYTGRGRGRATAISYIMRGECVNIIKHSRRELSSTGEKMWKHQILRKETENMSREHESTTCYTDLNHVRF